MMSTALLLNNLEILWKPQHQSVVSDMTQALSGKKIIHVNIHVIINKFNNNIIL